MKPARKGMENQMIYTIVLAVAALLVGYMLLKSGGEFLGPARDVVGECPGGSGISDSLAGSGVDVCGSESEVR